MRFSEFASGYVKHLAIDRGASRRTCENYDLAYQQFRGYLQGVGLADDLKHFNGNVCRDFTSYLRAGGNKATSVNTKLAALASLARYGLSTQLPGRGRFILNENPIARVVRPKRQKPHERYLYKDEVRAMFAVDMPQTSRLVLALLWETNSRASALCAANVRDLSLDGDRVLLSVMEKGNNPRVHELLPATANVLLESLKQREAQPQEPLLVNQHGARWTRTHLSDMVARTAERAGITRIPVRAHLFARHTPGSLAGQDGASLFEVAAMLGHRDPNTSKRYVHGVTADAARARVRAIVGDITGTR